MDHAPIYRADEHRPPVPVTAVRRSVSLVTAVAALTISGVALGYHGFAPPGLDAPPAAATQNQGPSITVPVPIVALPLVNGGHPDLLAQLSSALVAPVQQVRAIVQPAPAPALLPPVPQFTVPAVLPLPPLSSAVVVPVDIVAAPEDAAPAVDDSSDVIGPAAVPLTAASAEEPVRLVRPATVSAATEAAPEDLDVAAVDDTPAPDADPVEDAPAAPAPAPAPPAQAPAPAAKAAAPVQKAAPPPPAPEPKPVEIPREVIPKVVIVIPHDDPKPQAHLDDGPKPDAKKGPPPPPAPAPAPQPKDDHGDQGHNNNNGGGNNNGGNKGPGKGGHG